MTISCCYYYVVYQIDKDGHTALLMVDLGQSKRVIYTFVEVLNGPGVSWADQGVCGG